MTSAESPGKVEEVLLVRHMCRSPLTRTARAARAGHRRQGIVLADGTRIRKKGSRRFTVLALRDLVQNQERILELVRIGALEVCDTNERALSYEALVEKLTGAPVKEPAPVEEPAPAKTDGYTEEDLLEMGLDALKDVAVSEFKVPSGDVKKLRAKQAVVDLIMEVATASEE